MTTKKNEGAPATVRQNAAGDVAIGAEIDGQFVPLVTVPKDRVVQQAAQVAEDGTYDGNDDDGKEG